MVVVLARVMLAALLDLPITKLAKVLPKFQPDVLNALVKLLSLDSILKAPVPVKVLLVGLGALFCKTKVPAEIVVVPSYVFVLDKTKIPDPVLVTP